MAELNNELRLQILNDIEKDIIFLSMHTKLCNPAIARIVYVYKLHGGIKKAIEQMLEVKTQLENYPDVAMTDAVMERLIFHSKMYNDYIAEDPYEVAISSAIQEGDERKREVMLERQRTRLQSIHNKKECVCYS